MKPNDAAIRKRTQIAKANRTMFLWIAVASALIGAAIVVSIFLFQKLAYNEKVLMAKSNTVTRLEQNNDVVAELQEKVRVLDTNTALASIKANPGDQALQVILDALPSDANSLALGSSLQNKLLAGIDGLSLESLQVDPVIGLETLVDTTDGPPVAVEGEEGAVENANVITFNFSIQGTDAQLKQALQNLERSIRTFKVNSITMEIQPEGPLMTVSAQAFYEPARVVELTKETVKQ